jgi:hypothetical protein
MTLSLYAQYAAVTAIFALMVVIISLSVKSWFDERTFTSNLWLIRQFNQLDYDRLTGALNDFDEHVTSTPGMRPFMHTPN